MNGSSLVLSLFVLASVQSLAMAPPCAPGKCPPPPPTCASENKALKAKVTALTYKNAEQEKMIRTLEATIKDLKARMKPPVPTPIPVFPSPPAPQSPAIGDLTGSNDAFSMDPAYQDAKPFFKEIKCQITGPKIIAVERQELEYQNLVYWVTYDKQEKDLKALLVLYGAKDIRTGTKTEVRILKKEAIKSTSHLYADIKKCAYSGKALYGKPYEKLFFDMIDRHHIDPR